MLKKKENKKNISMAIGVGILSVVTVLATVTIVNSAFITTESNKETALNNSVKQEKILTEDEKLLMETPLNSYVLYQSSENYNKFRLDAAKKVEELMAEGMTTEEACEKALDLFSTAVYEDRQYFLQTYGYEDYSREVYSEYLERTQN